VATSCASTTATSFTRGGQSGQDRSPPHPAPTPQRPPKRTPWAPWHHDADDASASALDKRGWNDAGPRVQSHNATRPPTRQQWHPQGSTWPLSHSSRTACATLRRHTSRPPAPMWWRTRTFLDATSWQLGTSLPQPTTGPSKASPASCHLPIRTGTRSGTSPAYRTR
jgi:hypothetical protein